MQKTRRILTGGWLGSSLSHFTRGWFEGEPVILASGRVTVSFTAKQPGVTFGGKKPGVTWEGDG